MNYLQEYGRWLLLLIVFWAFFYVDSQYDYPSIESGQANMDPVIPAEGRVWVKSIDSIKQLKRGTTNVQFKYVYPLGDDRQPKIVSLYGRVVGLPGDRVKITKGNVIVNGEPLDIAQVQNNMETDNMQEILIPRGHIYVLSDQRGTPYTYDMDSRMLGPIQYDLVVGVVD